MISEIRGKISQSGSNLSDRSEDKLTGDFFGAIRYLPVEEGLRIVLSPTGFDDKQDDMDWQHFLSVQSGYAAEYKFWPFHIKGEIDLLLEFEDTIVGVEVKYLSGISSEDEYDIVGPLEYEDSVHQLSRYSYMLEEEAQGRKAFLIFLAPHSMRRHAQKDLNVKYSVSPAVTIGFLSWEDIHTAIVSTQQKVNSEAQKLILSDAEQLLAVKDLVRFSGFNMLEDNRLSTREPYLFQNEKSSLNVSWSWPEYDIEEGQSYVFRTK